MLCHTELSSGMDTNYGNEDRPDCQNALPLCGDLTGRQDLLERFLIQHGHAE